MKREIQEDEGEPAVESKATETNCSDFGSFFPFFEIQYHYRLCIECYHEIVSSLFEFFVSFGQSSGEKMSGLLFSFLFSPLLCLVVSSDEGNRLLSARNDAVKENACACLRSLAK